MCPSTVQASQRIAYAVLQRSIHLAASREAVGDDDGRIPDSAPPPARTSLVKKKRALPRSASHDGGIEMPPQQQPEGSPGGLVGTVETDKAERDVDNAGLPPEQAEQGEDQEASGDGGGSRGGRQGDSNQQSHEQRSDDGDGGVTAVGGKELGPIGAIWSD